MDIQSRLSTQAEVYILLTITRFHRKDEMVLGGVMEQEIWSATDPLGNEGFVRRTDPETYELEVIQWYGGDPIQPLTLTKEQLMELHRALSKVLGLGEDA